MSGRITSCRSCGSDALQSFLDLGSMPPSDGLVRAEDLERDQPRYPLEVAFCGDCSLVQILDTVPPEKLFGADYLYFSSFSDALLDHSRRNVEELIRDRGLGAESMVVELASNDGYLLQNYVRHGIQVLGIDPAPAPVKAALERGVNSRCAFFGREVAAELRAEGLRADVIHANNVLAHVADTNGFVAGIADLLAPSGVAVIEVPYVKDLIDHCEFDTIYHEHLCYFSVTALDKLFRQHGLYLNRVKRLSIHGGSLRLFVEPREAVEASVTDLLALEAEEGIDTLRYFQDFSRRVAGIKANLGGLVADLKASGRSLAAYGAAAKGTILLNYVGLGRDDLAFVADRNVHKHGRYMPGVKVPIVPPERLIEDMPDYVLLLPWNFKDEILEQQAEYRERGGRFIVPIPTPEVV